MARFPVKTGRLKVIDNLDTGDVWVLKDWPKEAFFTIGVLSTDYDGDPQAYANVFRHKDLKPHDHLGNAGHSGNWWGLVTDTRKSSGHPIEQTGVGPAQPYKGFYISQNILYDATYMKEDDVRHWTDATEIPYVALPNSRLSMRHMHLTVGCYCLLVDLQTMKYCFAVFADSKAATPRMGEISKKAMDMMDSTGGGRVLIVVFPQSGQGQGTIPTVDTIQAKGREELKQFSYIDGNDDLVKAVSGITNLSARLIHAGYSSNTVFAEIDADGDIEVQGTFGRTR